MRKVLLLNPPGRRLYIRDQFCSHVSKGSYLWQPLDLLLLSGRLHASGHELAVVDAIAERLGTEAALARIARFGPDAVVFLTGSQTFEDDLRFIERVKETGVGLAIGIGDVLREQGPLALEAHPVIDATMNDFVIHGLDRWLEGSRAEAENMVVRTPAGIRSIPATIRSKTFTLPPPRYDLFPLDRYRMPFNRYHPYATVIASTGCPYACTFCPFARTPYRRREIDDILANLEDVRRLGIRQVHFADWTFAVNRDHTAALLEGMMRSGFAFTWSCLSRVDLVDRDLLALFKRAGCHLVEFGVESGSQAILDRYRKQITVEQVRAAFAWARELRLATLATFVLGLPGETRESLRETLDLALEIAPVYCSFNVASPRMGTALRQELIAGGVIPADGTADLDSSWSPPAFSDPGLPSAELQSFRRHAIRRFYLRPSYLARRLRRMESLTELRNHVGNGTALVWRALRSGARARTGS